MKKKTSGKTTQNKKMKMLPRSTSTNARHHVADLNSAHHAVHFKGNNEQKKRKTKKMNTSVVTEVDRLALLVPATCIQEA